MVESDKDLKVAKECYQYFVFGYEKDGDYINAIWMSRPEADFTSRYNKMQSVLSQLHFEMKGMQDMDKLIYAYNYVIQNTTYNLNVKYTYVGSGALVDGQVSGWQKINGRWYFFYSSGQMAADTYVDSYYVNENGEWIK